VEFSQQRTDISYGRSPNDPAQWLYMDRPSPGQANQTGYVGLVSPIQFSMQRGFYDQALTVEMTTESAHAAIHYSLDGSDPSESIDAMVYTGPLTITTTTCLRAYAFKQDYLPRDVETQTYIFIDDVIKQSQQQAINAGYPRSWKGDSVTGSFSVPADYGMDTQITQHPDYAAQMHDALLSIPTLSIVTDKAHLFDPATGIYTNPEEEGDETDKLAWERPASAELFSPKEKDPQFHINCGLRLQGGHSRKPEKSPKHAFSLRFRNLYGPGRLDCKLFGQEWPVDSFDSLHLRAGFNNSWIHWSASQCSRSQYMRDQWMCKTLTAMGNMDALQGIYVHLYLNGLYWGLYILHERPDADHYAAYNGGNAEILDAINGDPTYIISDPLDSGSVSDGTIDAWLELKDVVALGDWERIYAQLDVDNFIDWVILMYFAGNTDIKKGTNWRAAGGGPEHKPWRFYSWDAEHVLENVYQYGIGTTSDPSGLLDSLRQIEAFRDRFAARLDMHLLSNGVLTPENNRQRWLQCADTIDLAVIAESARWGDYRRDTHTSMYGPFELYTKNDHWAPEKNRLLNDYFPNRTEIVIDQFRALGLYP
jgi:hypothetical protein